MNNIVKYAALITAAINLSTTHLCAANQQSLRSPETMGQGNTATESACSTLSAADKRFMQESTQTNLLEVQLGQLAQQKTQSTDVKAFADRMIKDHSNAQRSLESVAQSSGIVLLNNLDATGKKVFNKLSKLNGKQFDLAYMSFNVSAHAKAVADMKREEHSIKNMQLKDWDTEILPTIKQHLSLAKQTDREVANTDRKTAIRGNSYHY